MWNTSVVADSPNGGERLCSIRGATDPANEEMKPATELRKVTTTDEDLINTSPGKTALLQGPMANNTIGQMRSVWEQPKANTFTKREGFLHSLRLDFRYDPTFYSTNRMLGCQLFIVKLRDRARGNSQAQNWPGDPDWSSTTDTLLDAKSDIDQDKLVKNVHYAAGAMDGGNVQLNSKYFEVLHKFNLNANMKTTNLGAMPGNSCLNWSVKIPLGRMKIMERGDTYQTNPITPTNPVWTGIDTTRFDPAKQIHLLMFANNAAESTSTFGLSKNRPRLAVRKTLTFSTSLD